jgi:hypothetical protein
MNEVTRILSAIEQGDPLASEQLLPLFYDELRKLAALREKTMPDAWNTFNTMSTLSATSGRSATATGRAFFGGRGLKANEGSGSLQFKCREVWRAAGLVPAG